MIEQTGGNYLSSKYAKALMASEAKVGKSCFLIAGALGVLPWQKGGGIVDDPKNLHVITFDANALGGIQRFLIDTCKASKEALDFRVYNLQDTVRKVTENDSDYDMSVYNEVMQAIGLVHERARGVPCLLISSLTGCAAGIERGIVGPPKGKGYSDPSKWKQVSHQLHEIQNYCQVDKWHCLWEAHIDKPAGLGTAGEGGQKESIRVSGEAGRNWGYNTEQVFRIRRQFGQRHEGTGADLVYLDTRPTLDFVSSGRNFTESLEPKEYDPALAFHKLGLQVGRWGAKK